MVYFLASVVSPCNRAHLVPTFFWRNTQHMITGEIKNQIDRIWVILNNTFVSMRHRAFRGEL
jgi:hypothetical protein